MKIRVLIVLLIISFAFNLGFLVTVLKKSEIETAEINVETRESKEKKKDKESLEGRSPEQAWRMCSDCLELKLTCSQVEQLSKHNKQFHQQINPLKKQLEKERAKLFRVLKNESFQEEEINQILKDICDLQSQIQKSFVMHFFQVKKILNNKQQERFYFYMGQCLDNSSLNNSSCGPGTHGTGIAGSSCNGLDEHHHGEQKGKITPHHKDNREDKNE